MDTEQQVAFADPDGDEAEAAPAPETAPLLIEELTIDGMCGVY